MAADAAAPADEVDVALDHRLVAADGRLVGDVAQRAADATRTEQRALRPAQRLHAIEVEEVDVGREQRQRDDAFIKVDADLFLHARLVADDLAGGDAAHRHLALARPEVLDRQARDVAREVFDRGRVGALDVGLGLRIDREGNVLQVHRALGRGDDDGLGLFVVGLVGGLRFGLLRRLGESRAGRGDEGKGGDACTKTMRFPHDESP